MNTGKHLIADVMNIINFELLKTIEGVEPLMKKIIEEMRLNVVGEVKHQFKPYGATMLYLLSESHLSIHTYVHQRYAAIDLYCCNPKIDMNAVLEIIYNFFNGECIIRKITINR
jgi:S-adenosylmethionine decarboxylase proenzyme